MQISFEETMDSRRNIDSSECRLAGEQRSPGIFTECRSAFHGEKVRLPKVTPEAPATGRGIQACLLLIAERGVESLKRGSYGLHGWQHRIHAFFHGFHSSDGRHWYVGRAGKTNNLRSLVRWHPSIRQMGLIISSRRSIRHPTKPAAAGLHMASKRPCLIIPRPITMLGPMMSAFQPHPRIPGP